ncbi:MAG: GntR family transcriptional regulator [Beijerinckiaceae bacterium]|nr:GntR family transcriptional regulator [Beijerinckiaceae bacterium]MCZ8300089.1 GntR family transcriptional regulator [Beijerinckiaceae bacterium]
MDGVQRITRVTLHDAVLNQLRDMIIEGKLPPGTRINEGPVGASLGVSRTPLREAIKTLASEGLVEILPAKGAIVRRFSEKDIRDILDVLKTLEQLAARLTCAHASDDEIAEIADLHKQMLRLYADRNRLAYFKLNQEIHSAIVRASGNTALTQVHEQLQARIKRVRFIGNELPERWAGAVAEHEEMNLALLARDGERLSEVLGRHLDKTLDRVRDAI